MIHKMLTTVMMLVMCLMLSACPRIVETGEVGVSKSFGTINPEELSTGVYLEIPIARTITIRPYKLQEITMESSVPTKDGMMVDVDATLFINRKADQVAEQFMTIAGDPWKNVVVPQFRAQIREAVSAQEINAVYQQEGRVLIAEATAQKLREGLEPHGFEIRNVLLRNVKLPDRFKKAIDSKLAAEQMVQEKAFELEQAVKEAEIEVARAKGAAEAQEIVRSTLSNAYLQYLWIKTLNANPNVIYVSTESNLPLFRTVNK